MTTILYPQSYLGFLSAIFEVYALKLDRDTVQIIVEDEYQEQLFGQPLRVEIDQVKADRIERGLRKLSKRLPNYLRRIYHSEHPQRTGILLHLIQRVFAEGAEVVGDATDDKVLLCQQLDKKMGREIHRMHAFVRFQETPDGLYAALVNPDFDVLPFLKEHFVARYPAQDWLIYDTKRHYGLHYDEVSETTSFVSFTDHQQGQFRQLSADMLAERETDYQQLWKAYFTAVDIPERRNIKLHRQHVPERYWKYLVEKQ